LKLTSLSYGETSAKADTQDTKPLSVIHEEKHEVKAADDKKAADKQPTEKAETKPENVGPKIDHIRVLGFRFEEELNKLLEKLKERSLPEALLKIKDRAIKEEESKKNNEFSNSFLDKVSRGTQKRQTNIPRPKDNANVSSGGFKRGSEFEPTKQEAKQEGFRISRAEISEEEVPLQKIFYIV